MRQQELNQAMEVVLKLISKESTDPKELADVLSKILREEVTLPILVDFIIERRHEREAADLPELPTISDLKDFLHALREPTPDNRKRWERRFKAGQARYWCPDCGFSGNDEDFPSLRIDGKHISCCNGLKDVRYFTRTWSPDEQAAFEAEQERMRPILIARKKRKQDAYERAKRLEPKVDAVLEGLDGVGEFVNEAEERSEIAPYVRGIVHRTTRSIDEIVAKWRKVSGATGPISPVVIAKAVNRVMLKEGSMQNVIDNLDNFEPSELGPVEVGEERHFFTREELVYEFTSEVEKWHAILRDREISTVLLADGRFVVSIVPKGWSEAHPCLCDDCKAERERQQAQ